LQRVGVVGGRRTGVVGDRQRLLRFLDRARKRYGLPEGCEVVSCYEAGRDGFWVDRWLRSVGIKNLVVDSSSIEVPRRLRRAKTDRLDGEKLLRVGTRSLAEGTTAN